MAVTFTPNVKIEGMEEKSNMPQIRLVDLEKDYQKISSWFTGYGKTTPEKSTFSKVGLIIEDLAAVWILKTDSDITIAEPMIGNPAAESSKRGNAVEALFEAALAYSRSIGAKRVFALTTNKTLGKRLKALGSEEVTGGLQLFRKEI